MTLFGLPQRFAALWMLALLCAALAGCVPGVNAPLPTPTPDLTLAAIPRMLTGTAGAPTITPTAVRSPTPTPTPTATPTPTPYPGHPALPGRIGQDMPAAAGAKSLLFTVMEKSEPKAIPGLKAREGQRYVEFDVLAQNPTGEAQEYNRLFFRLAAPARAGEAQPGAVYEPLAAATGPVLMSGQLLPGEWVRGRVAFAVSVDAPELWLRWRAAQGSADVWIDPSLRAASSPTIPATGARDMDELPGTGTRISASGITLVVDNTTESASFERTRAAKGSFFLILDVTITNNERTRTPFNVVYFRLKDGGGYEYLPVMLPSDALIIAGSLGRGQRVGGKVIFELPEELRPSAGAPLMMKYRPQVLVDGYEEIRVRVGD